MIWLIGNKGMLGSEVEKLLKERGITYQQRRGNELA
jgi:hypothetical protein